MNVGLNINIKYLNSKELPARSMVPYIGSWAQYGAARLAAGYCGLNRVPDTVHGGWIHGWLPEFMFVDPLFAVEDSIAQKMGQPSWVSTKSYERYLVENGFAARAIGLPISYLPPKNYHRIPRSLLVMPIHSYDLGTGSKNEEEYADAIERIRRDFDSVAVCISPRCIRQGIWVDSFRKRGFEIIEGADPRDGNSLERIQAILSQFEFMTTNGFGSHIAYGSAFGAKVSIYGPLSRTRIEDCKSVRFYIDRPGLAEKAVRLEEEETLRKHLGEFFVHPGEAVERLDWGRREIGYDNRISPAEMRRLFHWEPWRRVARAGRSVLRKLPCAIQEGAKVVKKTTERALGMDKPFKWDFVNRFGKNQSGEAVVDGGRYFYQDAATFQHAYVQIFERRAYDFPCIFGSPRILDCGANIGLPLRFWASKFPAPRITAFEPDPEVYSILKKNTAEISNALVELHQAAVWVRAGKIAFRSTGLETGHLAEVPSTLAGEMHEVPSLRLRDFLEEPVDFLKIDIEGAETEVLLDCEDRLGNVNAMYVEYHVFPNQPQRLVEILAVLKRTGFQYRVINGDDRGNPLFGLQESFGMLQKYDLWAWR
jgi:FkbM family methyltransferase